MARQFDSPPLPEFRFGVASVVPAEFLNQLDDMLYLYSDSVLPTHTGTQVLIQATAGDEAQLAIERRYFIQATSLYEPVVGATGLYDLYAVASYVPTSHATTVKPFDIVVATEPPADFEYTRHLAQVAFDGLLITDVLQNPHKLNAAQLDGHIASTEPSDGDVVPVASSSGRLARDFRPIFPGVEVGLGEVIDYWLPFGHDFNNPPVGYAYCIGQAIGPASQDISTATIILPYLNTDEYIIGADPDKAQGVLSGAADDPAQAPGVGIAKAASFSGGTLHDHTTPVHGHTYFHNHFHPVDGYTFRHSHVVATHVHALTDSTIVRAVWPNDGHPTSPGPWTPGIPERPGVNLSQETTTQGESVDMPNAYPAISPATAGFATQMHGSDTQPLPGGGLPWSNTFARIMKIREL